MVAIDWFLNLLNDVFVELMIAFGGAVGAFLVAVFPRKRSMKGIWSGVFSQPIQGVDEPLLGHCELDFTGCWTGGRMTVDIPATVNQPATRGRFKLNVTHRDGDCLQIDYRNEDKNIRQFGAIILDMSGDAKSLNGAFSAYGPRWKNPFCGVVSLNRQ